MGHRRDERPGLADQRRGPRSHDREELGGVDGEAALRIHLPDEAQRMAVLLHGGGRRRRRRWRRQFGKQLRLRGRRRVDRRSRDRGRRLRRQRFRDGQGHRSRHGCGRGRCCNRCCRCARDGILAERCDPHRGLLDTIDLDHRADRVERHVLVDRSPRRRGRADERAVVVEHRNRLDVRREQSRHALRKRKLRPDALDRGDQHARCAVGEGDPCARAGQRAAHRRAEAAQPLKPHRTIAAQRRRRCARLRRRRVARGRRCGRKARPASARRRSRRRSDWTTARAWRRATTAMPAMGGAPRASGARRAASQSSPTVAPAKGRHAASLMVSY